MSICVAHVYLVGYTYPMNTTQKTVAGKDLKVGDVVAMSSSRADVITGFRPYVGPLADMWPTGARIAFFAGMRVGMTIPNSDDFSVTVRA